MGENWAAAASHGGAGGGCWGGASWRARVLLGGGSVRPCLSAEDWAWLVWCHVHCYSVIVQPI